MKYTIDHNEPGIIAIRQFQCGNLVKSTFHNADEFQDSDIANNEITLRWSEELSWLLVGPAVYLAFCVGDNAVSISEITIEI